MSVIKIWNYLLKAIANPYGAAGLMGNLYAESALNPKNLQQSYERKLGYTDDSYTAAVDAGSYSNFVHDGAGYGLAQWTFHTRKAKLLTFARTRGASIGDIDMQLDYLIEEIKSYSSVWAALTEAKSVRAASDAVLTGYEKPANQGEAVKVKRASFGQRYFDTYGKKESDDTMATVKIGSARIDENGHATGGRAGDQTGKEVSTQSWYRHSKGWRVLRAKDPAAAEKIAQAMQWACDSSLIGYDQNQRETLRKAVAPLGWDIRRLTTAVETDCSALVRVCCGWAFQQDLGAGVSYFNTTSMCSALLKTGLFDELTGSQYTDRQDYLRRGDILCTRTQGHTVVVLSNGSKAGAAAAPVEGLSRGDYGSAVTALQQALLAWRPDCLPQWGADGDFGGETEVALRAYQAEAGLPVTGVYDEATRKALTAAGSMPAEPATPEPEPPEPEPPEGPAYVLATADVNVRSAPGTDARIIGVLKKGYTAPYQEVKQEWGGRDWYLTDFDGVNGWVSSKYSEVTVG